MDDKRLKMVKDLKSGVFILKITQLMKEFGYFYDI